MTDKEHKEEMKQDNSARKKHNSGHAGRAKAEHGHHEKQKLEEALKASEEKVKEWQDKYLRLSAEFDNYRKRTLKEKAEMVKTASEGVLEKFIPFVDDIERGLNAMNTSQDMDAVKEGMILIYNRFKDFLKHNGVKEIEALNQEFNTDLHEAVTKIPAAEEGLKGKVVDVIQKGYYLHDKVIRFPKVVIGE